MNAVDKCVSLLKELSNAKTDFLPQYNQSIIDECYAVMNKLWVDNERDKHDEEVPRDVLKVRNSMISFIKRSVLAYHHERLMRIKKLRWEFGPELPEEITCNLSEKERDWFGKYCENVDTYMSRLNDGKGWDLTLHRTAPKRIYIQVRCTADYGEFKLEDGTTMYLEKDSVHYLPLSQCEKLIHQGIFIQVMN